jgi:DNA-binding LacI/PurR family transcriptional regulator
LSIGVVLPTSDYIYRSILTGIDATLTRARATSTLLVSTYSSDLERQLVEELLSTGVDGLLFGPTIDEERPDHDFLGWLTSLSVPVTLIERRVPLTWPGPVVSSVCTSFPRGLALAVAHLVELGHRGVAFFGHGSRLNVEALQRKWDEIVSDFGLAPAVSPLLIDRNYSHWQSSLEPERVLKRIRDTGATALICRDDAVTLTMAHCARRLGVRIPEDLSLLTYDNEFATMCDPPLTAISPSKEMLGARASKVLLEHIGNHRRGAR